MGMFRLGQAIKASVANGLGSAAVCEVRRSGEVIEQLAVGTYALPEFSDGESKAIEADAVFDLASLTKPIAAAGVALALVSDGRLDLSSRVTTWFSEFAGDATVKDLLCHQGGRAAHVPFYKQLWAEEGGVNRARFWRERVIGLAAATQPIGNAREQAVYSDLGYILLGAILEKVAGDRLDRLFADLVALPLGLSATRFVDLVASQRIDAVATEVCSQRGLVQGEVHDENCFVMGGIAGHAGLFSSAANVSQFATAIISAWHDEQAWIGRWRSDIVRMFLAPERWSWCLGWDTPSAKPGVSHAGDAWPRRNAVGHLGFTGTSLWIDLQRRVSCVLLTNRVHPSRTGNEAAIKQLRRDVGDAAMGLIEP